MHASQMCPMTARVLLVALSLTTCSEASFKIPREFQSLGSRSDTTTSSTAPVNSNSTSKSQCLCIPGDACYPSTQDWDRLNKTVTGRLIQGQVVSQVCFGPQTTASEAACATVLDQVGFVGSSDDNPVSIMAPYWLNNSCNPLLVGSLGTDSCMLGNMAPYAIEVTGASDVVAGINFARKNNIRLSIKNTGHDYLGRSAGQGSLALWTHNLKDMTFLNYNSREYKGPALKAGAGVQVLEVYKAAASKGLRAVGGTCPTVGLAGGWAQGGGQGPLTAAYGLGADNILELEVVTAAGKLVTASRSQNSDLYWALSGGGPGNYGVVLSMTVKAHKDGPVAGLSFLFTNTDDNAYWAAAQAWIKRLLETEVKYPKFNSVITMTSQFFSLDYVTLPDATADDVAAALAPFMSDLKRLNITPTAMDSHVSKSFVDHYQYYTDSNAVNATNETVGNRLIPRSLAQPARLPSLVSTMRNIAANNTGAVFVMVSNNVTHANTGTTPGSNAVLPAWRDALFLLNFGMMIDPAAPWSEIKGRQVIVNSWMDEFKALSPGGGSYINEATFDDATWKQDYYGQNYNRLAAIKAKYDPDYLFFANTAVGSDVVWQTENSDGTGRLCHRRSH